MRDSLNYLARRVADDVWFLAPALARYARSEGLDDATLAARLGCPMENLPWLRLCRMPRAAPPGFGQDVDRIAERFAVNSAVLAEVVRRGQNLLSLGANESPATNAAGYLLAARERPDEPPPVEKKP